MSGVKTKAVLAGALAAFMASASAYALEPGYRELNPNTTLVIDTTKGQVIAELYPELAPANAERLLTLAHQNFYDGQIFHRVIEDFMAQTGDPQGTGTGGSSLPDVKGEFTVRKDAGFPMTVVSQGNGSQIGFVGSMPVESQVPELAAITNDGKTMAWGLYCQGVVGIARDNSPDSANSQFFLMRGANTSLEKRYTAVGMVITGLDVVRKIKIGEPAVNPDKMLKVRVLADIPVADRPQIEVMDTRSPQFQELIAKTLKASGTTFSPCDVSVPVKRLDTPPAVASAAKPAATPAASPSAPSSTALPVSPSTLQSQGPAGQGGF